MTYCKLRLDISQDINLDEITDFIHEKCNSYAYVIEGVVKDNPHIHYYLDLKCGTEVVRKKLRDLGLKGNKSYSLTNLDEQYPIEYLAYMMKEDKIKTYNIPSEVLDKAKTQQIKVSNQIKEKKEARKSVVQKIIEQIPKSDNYTHMEKRMILDTIIQYHVDNNLLVNENRLKSLFQSVMVKIDSGYKNRLIDKILQNI